VDQYDSFAAAVDYDRFYIRIGTLVGESSRDGKSRSDSPMSSSINFPVIIFYDSLSSTQLPALLSDIPLRSDIRTSLRNRDRWIRATIIELAAS